MVHLTTALDAASGVPLCEQSTAVSPPRCGRGDLGRDPDARQAAAFSSR